MDAVRPMAMPLPARQRPSYWLSLGICLMVLAAPLAGAADAATMATGKQLFDRWCYGCHGGKNRQGGLTAGSYVLNERYKGSLPADLEERVDLQPSYLKQTVRRGVNVMPATRKTEISDRELDILVAYLMRANPP
jgi:mono/diheme cytochrome c family protein